MKGLDGLQVLLTRPAGANDGMKSALEKAGCTVLVLPLLEIVPLEQRLSGSNPLASLTEYSMVVSISANASRQANRWLTRLGRVPSSIRWFAMGESSAAALADNPLLPDREQIRVPDDGTDSDALLKMPEIQTVAGCRILILRGLGGREVLAERLRARGAIVDYAELYDRRRPDYGQRYLLTVLKNQIPDVVVLLSGETLENWVLTVRQLDSQLELGGCTLLVASERVARQARKHGFGAVIPLPAVSEANIIKTLADWVQ